MTGRPLCKGGEARLGKLVSIMWSAAEKFLADDGWAIASYIGLTLLTSLFPFLIFVAALAGFLGSAELAKEAARLVFAEWPDVVARPIAEEVSNCSDGAAQRRIADAGRGPFVLFRLERDRGAAGRPQSRLRARGKAAVVAAAASVARAGAGGVACAAGAGFPGRARPPDPRRACEPICPGWPRRTKF